MKKAERKHMGAVAALGCIVCKNNGFEDSPAQVHHLRHQIGAGARSSHFRTIPLCPHHHLDGPYGEAFHKGKQAWEAKFGTELELLAQVNDLLGQAA